MWPYQNEQVEIKTSHSMFWIPLQYWAFLIIAMCGWMYAANTGWLYQ